jgi:hypothetical protein
MKFTVYKHISPNNKVYIGITSQPVSRRWNNGHGYRHNEYFYRAILKYGWDNFKHEILFTGLTKEQAEVKEIELIKLYNSTDNNYGYNIQNGGNYSGKHSEASKLKMSISQRKKIVTKEARVNMSDAHIVRPVAQLDKEGNIVTVWNGCKTASKVLGIPFQNISECVKHKGYRKSAGGYVWRYVDELSTSVL